MSGGNNLHPNVVKILSDAGIDDPVEAIRRRVRELVAQFCTVFDSEPPFDMDAFASFRSLKRSAEAPRHSEDSEIVPVEGGRVELRVNRERPITRQRFSIGHEIGHTLFPDYKEKVQCRKAIDKEWADPIDQVEFLCDVAASELMFPHPWFHDRVNTMQCSASQIVKLANDYRASPEAAVRRIVEISQEPAAVVFFSWKLKPTQKTQLKADRNQLFMFGEDPVAEADRKRMLRVDYSIVNDKFARSFGSHIPKDKSIELIGPIFEASSTESCVDGQQYLELGSINREFEVAAFPIYTSQELIGPDGQCSVGVVIRQAG